MTAREQLYEILSAEYDAFIARLKESTPDKIIDSAFEKTSKEDIVYCFEYGGSFDDNEIDVLLAVENPLAELYKNWVDTDVSHMDDLRDSISGFVVRETGRGEIEAEVTDKPPTLWNRLDRKLEDEYNAFIANLETKSPTEIIKSSFEKVFKEDLKLTVENGDYDDEQLTAMLSQDDLLDSLYQDWRDTDVTYMDILADCVDESVSKFVNESQREQSISEPPKPKAKLRESSLLGDLRDAAREVEARKTAQPANPAKKHDRGIE